MTNNQKTQAGDNSQEAQAEEFRKWIEFEVLKIIHELMKNPEVSQDRLKSIASRTLEIVKPGMSVEELFQKALLLNDDDYRELDPLVIKLIKEYEAKYNKQAVDQITALVRNGNFDAAENIVKKVLEYKMLDKASS